MKYVWFFGRIHFGGAEPDIKYALFSKEKNLTRHGKFQNVGKTATRHCLCLIRIFGGSGKQERIY